MHHNLHHPPLPKLLHQKIQPEMKIIPPACVKPQNTPASMHEARSNAKPSDDKTFRGFKDEKTKKKNVHPLNRPSPSDSPCPFSPTLPLEPPSLPLIVASGVYLPTNRSSSSFQYFLPGGPRSHNRSWAVVFPSSTSYGVVPVDVKELLGWLLLWLLLIWRRIPCCGCSRRDSTHGRARSGDARYVKRQSYAYSPVSHTKLSSHIALPSPPPHPHPHP